MEPCRPILLWGICLDVEDCLSVLTLGAVFSCLPFQPVQACSVKPWLPCTIRSAGRHSLLRSRGSARALWPRRRGAISLSAITAVHPKLWLKCISPGRWLTKQNWMPGKVRCAGIFASAHNIYLWDPKLPWFRAFALNECMLNVNEELNKQFLLHPGFSPTHTFLMKCGGNLVFLFVRASSVWPSMSFFSSVFPIACLLSLFSICQIILPKTWVNQNDVFNLNMFKFDSILQHGIISVFYYVLMFCCTAPWALTSRKVGYKSNKQATNICTKFIIIMPPLQHRGLSSTFHSKAIALRGGVVFLVGGFGFFAFWLRAFWLRNVTVSWTLQNDPCHMETLLAWS